MENLYRLDDLGWYQFERLVQALLKAELGIGVESWGRRRDWGRDAWIDGQLNFPARHIYCDGPFVFQSKFVENANAAGSKPGPLVLAAVQAEARAITKRRPAPPVHYVIVTNAPLTAQQREEIRDTVAGVLRGAAVHSLDAADIAALLDNQPNLRRAFPQLLSLRDLDGLLRSVVNAEQLQRSSATVLEAKELLSVFVGTRAYRDAWSVLAQHNFLVLEGPPEVGKTAIAQIIAITQLLHGWEYLACRTPGDVFRLFEPTTKQIFLADDAFGRTEYDPSRGLDWETDLPRILGTVDGNHWLIWTSRKHILARVISRLDLQGKAARFPKPADVVVDAARLDVEEKTLMLYRHAKAQALDSIAKAIVKRHAVALVTSPHFTPERIRRFAAERLPELVQQREQLTETQLAMEVSEAIRDPTKGMRTTYSSLEPSLKWILLAFLESSNETEGDLRERCRQRMPDVGDEVFGRLLEELSEAFLRRHHGSTSRVEWMHPSYRDLVIDELADTWEMLKTFLPLTSIEGIKLAVSAAGGAHGDRRLPLLKRHEAWPLLREAVALSARTGNLYERVALLTVLAEAVEEEREEAAKAELLLTLRQAVDEVRQRVDALASGASLLEVRTYLKASLLLTPLPQMLNLRTTWDRVSEALVKALEYHSDDVEAVAGALKEWAEFVLLAEDSEPRFLVQVGVPGLWQHEIGRAYAISENLSERCGDSVDEATLKAEARALEEISDAFEAIGAVAGSLAPSEDFADRLRARVADLDELANEVTPHGDDAYDMDVGGEGEPFSIEGVMSDL